MSLLVSYSACLRDELIAASTLEWAFSLDGKLDYDCILSLGDGMQREPIVEAAHKLFRNVTVIGSNAPNAWPHGKNSAFQNLVRHIDDQKIQSPFLWIEPDSIPLKKGWLKTIDQAHVEGGKPFTGYVHDALQTMECVGVYPPNFMEYSPTNGMLCRAVSWDRCCGAEIIQHVHRANHLFQFIHDIDGFPPTFPDALPLVRKDAVLFHSNKDGTLVQQLSKGKIQKLVGSWFAKEKPAANKELITVVLPVCAKDIDQAVHHAKWLNQLGIKWAHKAIIAFDAECPSEKLNELNGLLTYTFSNVERLIYPTPPNKQYPAVANWAFARVAEYMARGTAPWLWLEADAVVLKRDWLDTLQKEYDAAGKPFMGPLVEGLGHINGNAVYPHDTVARIPKALAQTNNAWDYASRTEINGYCHDASHLMAHVWGVIDGRPSQTNGTNPPVKLNRDTARKLVRPSAVILHRVKDNSLVELLMAGGWK